MISMNGSPHHTIAYRLSSEFRMQVLEGWSPSCELRGTRFWELTISMAECERLMFVTLIEIENNHVNQGELARVATLDIKALIQSLS
jgi:hypothetical protein